MDITEKLKARIERDERRHANMRHVYAYRRVSDGEITDNLLALPYNELGANKAYLEHTYSLLDEKKRSVFALYEIVRLGVWYKERMKFDMLKCPEVVLNLKELFEKLQEKK